MKILYDASEGAGVLEAELLKTLEKAASLCVESEGIDPERTEVSLILVSGEEIQTLNRDYRGVDRVTDVLSFPQYEDIRELPQEGDIPIGDVVICLQKVREQACEFGHSQEREMVYLFVHSICHLLGYDHMEKEDKDEMRAKEEKVMKQLGLERKTDERGI